MPPASCSRPDEVQRRQPTTAVVLCGGRGSRLGGVDKPLLDLAGKPLAGHVVARLRPQVDSILLSCSRSLDAYQRLGCTVVADRFENAGPLGGVCSALAEVQTPWLLTMPGDTPFLPMNLMAALAPHCLRSGVAVAAAGGRQQNLTMLLDARRTASLARFFAEGGRAAHRWLRDQGAARVAFDATDFLNVNTNADLDAARQRAAHAMSSGTTRRSDAQPR